MPAAASALRWRNLLADWSHFYIAALTSSPAAAIPPPAPISAAGHPHPPMPSTRLLRPPSTGLLCPPPRPSLSPSTPSTLSFRRLLSPHPPHTTSYPATTTSPHTAPLFYSLSVAVLEFFSASDAIFVGSRACPPPAKLPSLSSALRFPHCSVSFKIFDCWSQLMLPRQPCNNTRPEFGSSGIICPSS